MVDVDLRDVIGERCLSVDCEWCHCGKRLVDAIMWGLTGRCDLREAMWDVISA